MAVEWMDGFETWDMNVNDGKYDATLTFHSTSTANGRFGSRGIGMNSSRLMPKTVTSRSEYLVNVAWRPPTGISSGVLTIANFRENAAGSHLIFALNFASLNFEVYRATDNGNAGLAGGAVLLASAPSGVVLGQFHWLGLRGLIDAAAGVVEMRLNNATKLLATGVNTKLSTNAVVGRIDLMGGNVSSNAFDDYVIISRAGDAPTDFLPDSRIYGRLPNGVGASSQLVRTGGTASGNYTAVNEIQANDDTSYVASGTVGEKDSYAATVTGAPAGSPVYAVAVNVRVRKDDVGPRSVAPIVKSGASEGQGADIVAASSYFYGQSLFHRDPATNAAWALADADASQPGVKITA